MPHGSCRGDAMNDVSAYAATILDLSTLLYDAKHVLAHMGGESGFVWKLDLGPDVENAAFTSITHLGFDARSPIAHAITTNQKHRVRRLGKLFQRDVQWLASAPRAGSANRGSAPILGPRGHPWKRYGWGRDSATCLFSERW